MSPTSARCVPTLAVAAALCLAAAAGAAADEGFNPIFDGKSLDGWEGDPTLWSVQDGAITGTTTAEKPLPYNKFLIWRGGTPRNFELRAKVRLIGNSNSGIQYRSKQLKDAGEFVVAGYQLDIHPAPNYNGQLYDERGRGILAETGQKVIIDERGRKHVEPLSPVKPVKLDEWNEYAVVARGNHLVHTLNGQTAVDVVDHQEAQRELEGVIAFQVHQGPAMKVQFKDVVLKTLPDGGVLTPAQTPISPASKRVEPPASKPKAARKKGAPPRGPAPPAASADTLKTLPGFKVELVHTVSRDGEGSWVSMAVDPRNRLIVSDQYGKLFRVTPSPVGGDPSATKVEPVNVDIGEAQGLLWAFDSLYVVVNQGQRYRSGLYRVRDTDGDDRLDKVEMLRQIEGGGEHGPHGVVLAPDGKSLYVVAGNATQVPRLSGSVVPRVWGEDNLLPRLPDGAGFMRDELAPGGWVARVDPDGKNWELVSSGFRNAYDLAFNRDGELFTYDSDMEWDMSLPWYRPTRVCHVVSGSEFGYRGGSAKWPTYYLDSLPPVADIGPGSPTGVAFGYGARFPSKYQDALFVADWSYGKLYALHLKPDGASYSAEVEEFLAGTPLPLTDLVVNPRDGALYFAIGGRRTTSGLYRVVYTGGEPTAASRPTDAGAEARALRHSLEAYHGHPDPKAVDVAWPNLGHPDRFVRYAARVALEFQDPRSWRVKALTEPDPARALPALLALVRVSAPDPAHRRPTDPLPDPAVKERLFESLERVGKAPLSEARTLDLYRVYQVLLHRFGKPDAATAARLVAKFDAAFPAKTRAANVELAQLLVFLDAPDAAAKLVALLERAPTQEEQIEYARSLRVLKTGWTPALRKQYLSWFLKAAGYQGGNSFPGFIRGIKSDAVADLSASEKAEFKPLIDAPVRAPSPASALPPRPHVKDWTMADLLPAVESGLTHRNYDRGRAMFAAAACFSCHRFHNEGGGAGPDLTGLAGRFTTRDLLESIIHPSKVISDQYGAVMIATSDGQVVTGRIVNLNGDTINVNTNMLNPNLMVGVDRRKIEEMKPSPVSMMPEGLLNTLNRDEVLDLMAYLLSRGDPDSAMFK